MKAWRMVRIDFTEVRPCYFCPNVLRSGVAHWLVNHEGKEVPAGETCAQNNAIFPEKVPNFTRGPFKMPVKKRQEARPTIAAPPSPHDLSNSPVGDELLEYLILRVEKLADFDLKVPPRMRTAHERYRAEGRLSRDDEIFLENLVKKLRREQHFSLLPAYLQACYSLAFWMKRLLVEEGDAPYVYKKLKKLRDRQTLTPAEVGGLNGWFRNRRGYPQFDPEMVSHPSARGRKSAG